MLALLFGLYYDVAEKKQSQTERSAFMAEEMKDLLQNNAPDNAEAVTESAAEGTGKCGKTEDFHAGKGRYFI